MDDLYYETYNEGETPEEESKTKKTVKIVLTSVFLLALLFVIGFFFYRMWEMKEPRGAGGFIWTESAANAKAFSSPDRVRAPYNDESLYAYEHEDLTAVFLTYKNGPKSDWETVAVEKSAYYENEAFRVFTANTGSFTVTNADGSESTVKCSGYYENKESPVDRALRVSDVWFVPKANEVQLTFRYKSNVLDKLNGTKGLDGSTFTLALCDDKGKIYPDYSYKTAKRGVYRYITMVFEGVDFANVEQLDLAAQYLTDNGAKTLFLYVYDNRLSLPVYEKEVRDGSLETLTKFILPAALPPRFTLRISEATPERNDLL